MDSVQRLQNLPSNAKIVVVIPTYNEADNLPALAGELLALAVPGLCVLIVDDNSPDGTGEVAAKLARECRRVRVLHRPGKMGLGKAYIAGFKDSLANGADMIFEMDADFSHNPADLPRLLAALGTYDGVIGSRYVAGGATPDWSLERRLISRSGNMYTRLLLNLPIRDATSGFKGFRRQVLASIDLDSLAADGYAFQIEMNYRLWQRGFSLGEVPIVFLDRRVGTSKMSSRIVLEAMALVWQMRREGRHAAAPSARPGRRRFEAP